MIKQRRISLGSFIDPGGSTYIIRNQDDLLQMAVDFEYIRLYENDILVTPSLHELIIDRVQREQVILAANLSSLGVPSKLINLFEIKSKSETEKYCRNLHFNEFELFLLIHNCSQINFRHEARFHEHIPADRTIAESDHQSLHKGNKRKFATKLTALLKYRKQSHVHLFESGTEWHLFYFSYNDTAENKKGHWEAPHLHYISHLWTHSNKDEILESFEERRSKISGYHIKFTPFEFSDFLEHHESPPTIFGRQPLLLAINSRIPPNPNSSPIPIAHIATRGVWITSISILPRRNIPSKS